jgi:7-cyano-7-deazaguanine synthase
MTESPKTGFEERRPAVVLLSGGLDSATVLTTAIEQGFRAYALSVRYGQRHEIEIERAIALARVHGATEHRVVDLDLAFVGASALLDRRIGVPKARSDSQIADGIPPTYVPARNTVLLALALAWAEALDARDLFIGVNAVDYSGYPDCRPEFLAAFETLARLATRVGVEGQQVRLHAPLLELTKAEIVRRARELGGAMELTLSCYDPGAGGEPCGSCDACRLRARGFREAGIDDPALARIPRGGSS